MSSAAVVISSLRVMSKQKHKTKYNVGAGVHLYFITSTIQPSKYILSCLQQLVDVSTANINPLCERMYILLQLFQLNISLKIYKMY